MNDYCNISDFYLRLKLGIFSSARINNLGYLSLSKANDIFLKKPLSTYQNQLYTKKQLSIGLYLMDSYLLNQNNDLATYILVVAVCRTTLDKKEKLYVLKLSEATFKKDLITIFGEADRKIVRGKRKSIFRKKSKKPYFDSSPLNSTSRKH